MRIIPPIPHDKSTGTERQVFSLIDALDLGEGSVALASLNLAEHEYKRWSEIDFVLISQKALLVIEVKGGSVSAKNGIWQFEDRLGRIIEKAESPIAQAQSGFSSLLNKYLIPEFSSRFSRKGAIGFCVVFPKTSMKEAASFIGGPEMPSDLIGTQEDCVNGKNFSIFIERVKNYWQEHSRSPTPGWQIGEVRSIAQFLRPNFDRVPPLSLALTKVRQEQLSLTEDQYQFLDYLESADRILCMGGAGCGKTFLAVEALRREMANNPVLITGTSYLAKHLRSSNVPDASRIFSFEEISSNPPIKKYSVLIVDEGQQITNFKAFNFIGSLLDKPLHESRWRWFSDPNNQLSISSNFDESAQRDLGKWANIIPILKENCRNTPQVIRAVEFATGATVGSIKAKGEGPEVIYSKGDDLQAIVEEAANQINEWLSSGNIDPGEILFLSAAQLDKSIIPRITKLANKGFVPWRPGWDADPRHSRFFAASTIEEFRGLESPFVILCDLCGEMDKLEADLYLGMTRANFGLYIAAPKEVREQLLQARISKLTKI